MPHPKLIGLIFLVSALTTVGILAYQYRAATGNPLDKITGRA